MRKAIYLLMVLLVCGCYKPAPKVKALRLAPMAAALPVGSPGTVTMVHDPCPAGTEFNTVSLTAITVDPNIKVVVPMTVGTTNYWFVCDKDISVPARALRENAPPQ